MPDSHLRAANTAAWAQPAVSATTRARVPSGATSAFSIIGGYGTRPQEFRAVVEAFREAGPDRRSQPESWSPA